MSDLVQKGKKDLDYSHPSFSVTGMGRVELDVPMVQCDPLRKLLKDIRQ